MLLLLLFSSFNSYLLACVVMVAQGDEVEEKKEFDIREKVHDAMEALERGNWELDKEFLPALGGAMAAMGEKDPKFKQEIPGGSEFNCKVPTLRPFWIRVECFAFFYFLQCVFY